MVQTALSKTWHPDLWSVWLMAWAALGKIRHPDLWRWNMKKHNMHHYMASSPQGSLKSNQLPIITSLLHLSFMGKKRYCKKKKKKILLMYSDFLLHAYLFMMLMYYWPLVFLFVINTDKGNITDAIRQGFLALDEEMQKGMLIVFNCPCLVCVLICLIENFEFSLILTGGISNYHAIFLKYYIPVNKEHTRVSKSCISLNEKDCMQ